ncbi:hypothetical protein [Nostoc sp. UHCC 0870]|uniref:hypothetical protein n=1 Tax=Nostoc sp. UHCC 0870 TaxID=2914041 RepID=UPI001EDE6360|nr:hypothetical protein [Nostoc sp. UHCC 0870]UKO99660.1 hypothetical protein L6494_08120 [Nostoc sp. UHCC 0870]
MDNWQDMTDTRLVRPIHPGEVIADILDDLDIDSTKFAEILGVSNQIVNIILYIKIKPARLKFGLYKPSFPVS